MTIAAFDALRTAASGATLGAELLEDGSLLITLDGEDAAEQLLRRTIRARQIRAKEALFDSIEQSFGAEIASRLWTAPRYAAILNGEAPLTAEQAVQLIRAAERLSRAEPCPVSRDPGAPASDPRPSKPRRLRLVSSNDRKEPGRSPLRP